MIGTRIFAGPVAGLGSARREPVCLDFARRLPEFALLFEAVTMVEVGKCPSPI
jgi:hypothetical protein